MKVIIVSPPAKKIVEPYYDRPNFPRTALAFLAGHLRRSMPELQVHVKDAKFDRESFDTVCELIVANGYDVLALTAMTNEIKAAALLAKMVKAKNPKIITVIGGVHVTAIPKRTMEEFPEFDYGVIGEGEQIFENFLRELLAETQVIQTAGVCFITKGTYNENRGGMPLADQDSLTPAWDMFRSAEEYMIQTSRGCPFTCNFCMNPGGRIVRARSVETTLDEIGFLLDKMQPKSLYFGDEIFTVKKSRVMEICEGMIRRGYHKRVKWWCQTHVNTLDRELVKVMKEAGCILVGLGIETGDEETLKHMGKGINKDKIKKAIKILKEEKLNFDSMFILGQPNETLDTVQSTIDFAVELNPATPIFGLMVPYPGTQVGEMAMRGEGGYKLLSHDWDAFNKQIGNALELKGITRVQLERIQFMGYIQVFLYNFRFLDFFKFCFRYKSEGFEALKRIAVGR